MSNFVMRPEDELMHRPDGSMNFNESVYTNGFNTASPVGGWMRLGKFKFMLAAQSGRSKLLSTGILDESGARYTILNERFVHSDP